MLSRTLLPFALAFLAACGDGGSDAPLAPPLSAETTRPGATTRVWSATIDVAVSGAATVAIIDHPATLRIVEHLGGENPTNIWFFSISAAGPVALPDGRNLLFTADLSPGLYEGPGTYQLSDQAGTSVDGVPGLGSAAYVQVFRSGPEPEIARFDRFGEPCTLEVGEEHRTGRVRCPSLLGEGGGEVALSWTWSLETAEA